MNKKVLSKAVSQLDKAKAPAKPKDIITDPAGQWKFLGQDTRIPGNGKGDTLKITMEGVPVPVFAQPNVGPGVMMKSGKKYKFPDADYVDESPQMKKGGVLRLPKMPKPSKKGVLSKAYSRSLDATNKLFTEHILSKKIKSKKGKVFDPNANYQDGGEYIETDLADDEIEELRKGGYIVEDISVPSVGSYKQGGALLTKKVTCKKCGWKWDAADGGDDITTCHKCGGQGLIHAQLGQNTKSYTDKEGNTTTKFTKPDGTTYIKVRNADGKEYNKTTFTPTSQSNFKHPLINNNASQAEKLQQSAGNSDWFWGPALIGGAGLKSAGAIANTIGSAVKGVGATAIPGMASVPGATVGNLVNSGFIANSLYHAPGNVKEWYDVSQGKKDWKDAAIGTGEIALGLVGSGAGAKAALQEAEKLGLKNVVKGKASIKDVFKRDDLVNINTADDLASYEKALESGTVSPTRNRFYSSSKNPDLLNYAKGEENVFVHRVPQTKAASAGKSLATVKPKGAALTARERSIPTSADVESLVSSGKLSGQSEETIQGLKEVAANPEGYWNLPTFQNNAELQALVKDPNLVNPAEHFLPRPDVSNFELMPISAIASSAPKLINTNKITNAALTGLKEESIGNHLIKHESVDNMKNEHKLGGNTNDYIELYLTPKEIKWYKSQGYIVKDIV